MYKPNFCAECGSPVSRRQWLLWTSRRFCGECTGRYRKAELALPLILGMALLTAGFIFGRFLRPAPPPLIVQRLATSSLSDAPFNAASLSQAQSPSAGGSAGRSTDGVSPEEIIYTCGARTKKGTPCARRVHGPVRCWQHKGMPAILPQEKLLIKG
ncbi:MAG: hypothetical protein ABI596_14370 [Pyrinomonadaceae bacterium]